MAFGTTNGCASNTESNPLLSDRYRQGVGHLILNRFIIIWINNINTYLCHVMLMILHVLCSTKQVKN